MISILKADLPPYYQPWMEIARNVTELIGSHSLPSSIQKQKVKVMHYMSFIK